MRGVVYALNKPAGVVSTARDPRGRPTVVTLVPQTERLYPVGRLDIDTTGLILLTNEGDLAHRLTHPSFEVEKTYRAVCPVARCASRSRRSATGSKSTTAEPRRRVSTGCPPTRSRSRSTRAASVRSNGCARRVGHPVKRLERIAFGPCLLGDLPRGRWRRLDQGEVDAPDRLGRWTHSSACMT